MSKKRRGLRPTDARRRFAPGTPPAARLTAGHLLAPSWARDLASGRPAKTAVVDVVIPVFNEERALSASVHRLWAYLEAQLPVAWRIVIADNASTDQTWLAAQHLTDTLPHVEAIHLDRKGRGLALKTAWLNSDADVLSYMDVDLSTNLESFLPLLAPLLTGHSDVAIGTRLAPRARVTRQLKREVLSRGYNGLIRTGFGAGFSDAQCGFKAIRASAARKLLPLVEDCSWFFDTELLLLAERNGMRIFEVPVDWVEDLDSRVVIRRTVAEDLQGLWRLRRAFWRGDGVTRDGVGDLLASGLT
ncbi:MAG: glycosyltransferase family 2 protein [Candidatus Dormibacteraeota bacterium]|uniref:dolichyl-phosphate beta-glucosyltransferase n=1 Tax=Candidatus Dormiibacter inghamiae TaxID=3127013 RepID=A0A934KBY8_9BACT|nr:glycosyltransferase family 2 protein [Candidatus Dormibacteraeota bacterium]MBJ7607309.1 glycosyltransferase family 2 protein [Candidatus Dormibacteraeota bacterium]